MRLNFFQKTRFIAAWLHAYLDDDLWIRLATHANAMAERLIEGIQLKTQIEMAWPCESNELFVTMPTQLAEQLEQAGASSILGRFLIGSIMR